jgi:hypothetical protein
MTRCFQTTSSSWRGIQGEILSDRKAILQRWNQHFKEFDVEDRDEKEQEEQREEEQRGLMEATVEEKTIEQINFKIGPPQCRK